MVLFASPTTGRVEPFEWVEGRKLLSRRVKGRVTVNSAEAAIAACIAGLGVLQIPAYDVRAEMEAGLLAEVLPAYPAESMPANLLFLRRRERPRRVRLVRFWSAD